MKDKTASIFVQFTVVPEKLEEFRSIFMELVRDTRLEPGLEQIKALADEDDPNRYFLLERWRSQADFECHITSGHFLTFGENLQGLCVNMVINKVASLE